MKFFVAVIISAIASGIFSGCNPVKKAVNNAAVIQDAVNDYIAKHPPRIDTVTEYKPGAPQPQLKPVFVIDSERLAKLADSLKTHYASKYRYDDADCSRMVSEAFNTGYSQAAYDCNKAIPIPKAPDTVLQKKYPTEYIQTLLNTINQQQGEITVLKQNQKSSSKWLWWFIASAAVNVLLIVALLKKLL